MDPFVGTIETTSDGNLLIDGDVTEVHLNGAQIYPTTAPPPNPGGGLPILNVKDFGAVGDGVTDDAPAFQAAVRAATLNAIRTEFAVSPAVYVPPVDTFYRIGSEIEINRTVRLFGEWGSWLGASRLVCVKDITCINIRDREGGTAPDVYTQQYSGVFCTVEGLRIECDDPTTTEGYGILSNATCNIKDCFIQGFGRDGVFINGNIPGDDVTGNDPDPPSKTEPFGYYGNANLFQVENVTSWTNKGNGFRVLGNNVNAGMFLKCDASRNKGVGFLDESSLGNTYVACHVATNATNIRHAGKFYVCIKVHTSSAATEPGTGGQWRKHWQEVTAQIADSDWANGTEYLRSGSFHSANAAAHNCYMGCYSEAGIQGAAVLSDNDVAVGGNLVHNVDPALGINMDNGRSVTAVGALGFPYTFTGRPESGAYKIKASLGTDPDVGNFLMFGHSDDAGAPVTLNGLKFTYDRVKHSYEMRRDPDEKNLITFTTPNWARNGFSGDNQLVFEQGAIFGGGTFGKVRSYDSIAGIPNGLEVTDKDVFLLTGARNSGDPTMAKCTVPGLVGSGAVIVGVAPIA